MLEEELEVDNGVLEEELNLLEELEDFKGVLDEELEVDKEVLEEELNLLELEVVEDLEQGLVVELDVVKGVLEEELNLLEELDVVEDELEAVDFEEVELEDAAEPQEPHSFVQYQVGKSAFELLLLSALHPVIRSKLVWPHFQVLAY